MILTILGVTALMNYLLILGATKQNDRTLEDQEQQEYLSRRRKTKKSDPPSCHK